MYGRMRHGQLPRRGFGPGRGFGPPRHRARRGAVRDAILQLLAERPRHGYELINEIDARSGGRWKPSPGSIYPTLSQLEDLGLVTADEAEGRKQYSLTDAGRSWVERHAGGEHAAPWDDSGTGGRGDLRRLGGELLGQLRQIGQFGSPHQIERARQVLSQARTELYQVLATPDSPDPAEPAGDVTDEDAR